MTIDAAIRRLREVGVSASDETLRKILSSVFEGGMNWMVSELRRNVAECGPDVLLDHRIDIYAGRNHGVIRFSDGEVCYV